MTIGKVVIDMNAKQESTSAAANPFLDADGHFNVDKVRALNEKVQVALAKFKKNNPDAKEPKAEIVYAIPRKAKPVKYSKSLEAKKDLKYMTRRAIKVVSMKRISDAGLVRNQPILTVYSKDVIGALATQVKLAVTAMTRHYNKAIKTKEGVSKIRDKNREQSNKEFDASLAAFRALLEKAGVKETDLVESQGMMGRTVLLKVGKENVVSIGKADLARFRAAQKAARSAE